MIAPRTKLQRSPAPRPGFREHGIGLATVDSGRGAGIADVRSFQMAAMNAGPQILGLAGLPTTGFRFFRIS
jgi:hypothetical protein